MECMYLVFTRMNGYGTVLAFALINLWQQTRVLNELNSESYISERLYLSRVNQSKSISRLVNVSVSQLGGLRTNSKADSAHFRKSIL